MKKLAWTAPSLVAVIFAACAGFAAAAPYGPEGRATTWVQPDGQVLDLRVFGDEYYGRTETTDGYTVVYNRVDNSYHFAGVSADGSALIPTGPQVGPDAKPAALPHLALKPEKAAEIANARRAVLDKNRAARWSQRVTAANKILTAEATGRRLPRAEARAAKIQAAPITGAIRGLTILAQFPDDPKTGGNDALNFPTSRDKIIRFCNQAGYRDDGNAGSVRDYFYEQSLGKLTYTQTVTPVVTLPHPRAYYNFSDYPKNRVVREDAGESGRMLLTDAINTLKSQNFDFTSLTTDAGGFALATNIFFAGPDSGVYAEGLWPHQYSLDTPISVGTGAKTVSVFNYQITNNGNSSPIIGTFCHENGHLILDYPDIYSVYDGEGVGEHCLMGSGNNLDRGRTPAPIDAYLRDLVGWENVQELGADEFKTLTLPTTGNVAVRIRKPGSTTEFYMMENRGNGDRWAEFVPDKGIAIWHVDTTMSGNTNPFQDHYEISLMQADGRNDLENGRNRGDAGDLWDASTGTFSDATKPNGHWWDGTDSGVVVNALSFPLKTMRVAFGAVPPNTIIVTNPNGGEILYPDAPYTIEWLANITGNVKIGLYKNGVFASTVTSSTQNDGSFLWNVPKEAGGFGYTIRISSITNAVPTQDDSDAPFLVNTKSFPAGGKIPHGWSKARDSHESWNVTKKDKYEGIKSITTGGFRDGKTASLRYRSEFLPGRVTFYMKVSSERGFDFARFYIDGVEQQLSTGIGKGISGTEDWRFHAFPISSGKHTLMWTYEKDDSYGERLDSVWIDGVTMPATTQEIVVSDDRSADLANGTASYDFQSRVIGKSGLERSFTIRNTGGADLSGISVTTTGAAAADYVVSGVTQDYVEPGKSLTFKVAFKPGGVGARSADLRIVSNDTDEGKFVIGLSGTGVGLPQIALNQGKKQLKDHKGVRKFGSAGIGSKGKTRTYTITNNGFSRLDKLSVSRHGRDAGDFRVSGLTTRGLAPGESTTFKVTFSPKDLGKRKARIHVRSNDRETKNFKIDVSGTGKPKKTGGKGKRGSSAKSATFASTGSTAPPVTTTEVIDGRKYLALTISKQNDADVAGKVQVSSDLLDWSSGRKHTTVLIDNGTTLKVRDNTPVTPDAKRFIRLK